MTKPVTVILFVMFTILFIINVSFANRSCSKQNGIACKEAEINKYSKGSYTIIYNSFITSYSISEANSKYKKYLNLIEDARKNYVPCKQVNCSCHSEVINKDLSVFKNGITDKLLKNIASKFVYCFISIHSCI